MTNRPLRVAVGMSGGVDSSVTAALLINKGYDVTGITMEIYDGAMTIPESGKQPCYSPGEKTNIASAEAVCKKLNIPFHVIDLKREFREHVINYFRSEYLNGRTPNPCILCNRKLKFGFLLQRARQAGIEFDRFATGHYARIVRSDNGFVLKKPMDTTKDQTYFLFSLTQEQLAGTLFPLGEYSKNQVRNLAGKMGLSNAERPESQDFLPEGGHRPFFSSSEIREGDIINENGDVLGRHKGIVFYTIGQRKGLGISSPEPVYVTSIDSENNRIIVGGRSSVYSEGLIARVVNIMDRNYLNSASELSVKIRLNHKGVPARVFPVDKEHIRIIFSEPQPAVTPGQYAVIYSKDIVAGGGIIERAVENRNE